MAKTTVTKPAKAPKAVPAPVAAPKPAKAPRKAATPLAAGLVMDKAAPAALVLTAPAVPARKPRKDAVEGPTESMGFRVPAAWAKEFRTYSFHRGTKMHQTLMDALEALKEKEAV